MAIDEFVHRHTFPASQCHEESRGGEADVGNEGDETELADGRVGSWSGALYATASHCDQVYVIRMIYGRYRSGTLCSRRVHAMGNQIEKQPM